MTMAPVRGWDIQYYGANKQSVLEVDLLETENIGKCKHLSDFEGTSKSLKSRQNPRQK